MKIKSLGMLTVVTLLASGMNANANALFDIYAGGTYGYGGYSLFMDDDEKSNSSLQSYGAVLGMDIPFVRLELEYNYVDADEMTLNLGLVNAYFKLPVPVVKPYIGAGIGMTFDSRYKPENMARIDIEDDTIAYQGMLGVTLDLPVVPFNIDIEGRVLVVPELYKIGNENIDLFQYEGRAKLRFVF